MVEKNLHAPVKLFYSYSHKDETHRENMEKSLAILEQDSLLYEWFKVDPIIKTARGPN